MRPETGDVLWLDGSQQVSFDDLVVLSGLSKDDILELVDAGALVPRERADERWTFSADCLVTVRKAGRLRDDLELDSHALALALSLLEQIRTLEAEVSRLRAQMPAFRRP